MAASESVTPNLYVETLTSPSSERHAISGNLFRYVVTVAEISADFLACAIAVLSSCLFSFRVEHPIPFPARQIAAISIVFGVSVVLLLHKDGAYRGGGSLLRIRETERTIRVSAQSLFLVLPLSMLAGLKLLPALSLGALALIPMLLLIEKQIMLSTLRLINSSGLGMHRVVVYGAGQTGRRIISALFNSPRLGLSPVAVIDHDPDLAGRCVFELGYRRSHCLPVYCGPATKTLLQSLNCDLLVVPTNGFSPQDRTRAICAANQAGSRVAFLTAPTPPDKTSTESINIDGLLLTARSGAAMHWHYAVIKRAMDLAVSSLLLVLLAPLLSLIALLVRLDSPGPAFFIQKRVGRNGHLFNMYKFRSMYADTAQYDFSPIDIRDRRITRIGRFLRRTSLDELPQLLNVLRGEMSLVGPRPEMPFIVERYNSQQRHRLHAIPGITGLWQLSADRAFLIHENLHYDLYYIRHRSFFMDVSILIHTLFFAMHGV